MALGVSGPGPAPTPRDATDAPEPHGRPARVLLIRHAEAGGRVGWSGPDRDRPLTEVGRAQAEQLAARLDGQRLDRLLTSGYVRCVETMAPLAARRRLTCNAVGWLEEGADPAAALTALLAGGSVAACSHGDVVSGVLFELADRGVMLGPSPRMQKGSIWVLEVEEGRVSTAHYLAPPG
jgi:8-oxo-dGTP diphosphatase